jgi:hypothetical protein
LPGRYGSDAGDQRQQNSRKHFNEFAGAIQKCLWERYGFGLQLRYFRLKLLNLKFLFGGHHQGVSKQIRSLPMRARFQFELQH